MAEIAKAKTGAKVGWQPRHNYPLRQIARIKMSLVLRRLKFCILRIVDLQATCAI
jgi:hypothetical protein